MTELGLLQVYTGNGKGKTTAALGLALRACGHGFRVLMIQFMKGSAEYGEAKLGSLLPTFTLRQVGRNDFVDLETPAAIDVELATDGWKLARDQILSGLFDIVILDEINVALACGLLDVDSVSTFLRDEWKTRDVRPELLLTGRYAPKPICDMADLVTEMRELKHPYAENQTAARCGSEF